jgi:hypothetical protein
LECIKGLAHELGMTINTMRKSAPAGESTLFTAARIVINVKCSNLTFLFAEENNVNKNGRVWINTAVMMQKFAASLSAANISMSVTGRTFQDY